MLNATSKNRLSECHEDLQLIVLELAKDMDICVICGHRGKEDQDKAVSQGRSKAVYPKSKHNSLPSMAVDIAPVHGGNAVNWNDIASFNRMLDKLQLIADKHGITVKLGRSFSFRDYPHCELA